MDEILITLDIDWAPDFVVDLVSDQLLAQGVRATWLATHASPAVERIKLRDDLFDVGIHPNFGHGSTHGSAAADVLAHCLEIVPDASCVRSHGLVQSSALLELLLLESRVKADLSLFLPYARHLAPVEYSLYGSTIARLPYFWEDDYEFAQHSPIWDPEVHLSAPGLKIFNFHPIHIYLNSGDVGPYSELKEREGSLAAATRETTSELINQDAGTSTFFARLISHLAALGGGTRVCDLVQGAKT